MPKHLKLMIPGPIEVEDEVLSAMGGPVQPHYGDEWVDIHNETIRLLQQVIGTTGRVFMMPGSGSLALDATVQSMFAPGAKVALGINGHFGHRLLEILEANGIQVVRIEADPSAQLDPQAFASALADNPEISGVALVHLETPTAVLNPVREIAAVTRSHNKLCLVDAVSSLAGTAYHMDDWQIDATVSASQKGLGGTPGVGIVAVGPRAWEAISAQEERPRSWYLDLRRWQWYVENWGDWHPFPVTMPTSVILGLQAALQLIEAEGPENRLQQYEILAAQLRNGLRALGLRTAVPDALMSPVLTAVYMPDGISSSELVRYLADEYNIKITTGFGALKEQVFRVGHMGGVIETSDIDKLVGGIGQFLSERKTAPTPR